MIKPVAQKEGNIFQDHGRGRGGLAQKIPGIYQIIPEMLPGQLPFSTGKGVILAALTTTVGFGTLMVSHHQGIFSLGFVAWAGSLCVLIAAIVLLPAILAEAKAPRINLEKEAVQGWQRDEYS